MHMHAHKHTRTHTRTHRMTEVKSNVQVDVCCGLVGSAFKHDIIGRMSSAEPRIKQLFRLVRMSLVRVYVSMCACVCSS